MASNCTSDASGHARRLLIYKKESYGRLLSGCKGQPEMMTLKYIQIIFEGVQNAHCEFHL